MLKISVSDIYAAFMASAVVSILASAGCTSTGNTYKIEVDFGQEQLIEKQLIFELRCEHSTLAIVRAKAIARKPQFQRDDNRASILAQDYAAWTFAWEFESIDERLQMDPIRSGPMSSGGAQHPSRGVTSGYVIKMQPSRNPPIKGIFIAISRIPIVNEEGDLVPEEFRVEVGIPYETTPRSTIGSTKLTPLKNERMIHVLDICCGQEHGEPKRGRECSVAGKETMKAGSPGGGPDVGSSSQE